MTANQKRSLPVNQMPPDVRLAETFWGAGFRRERVVERGNMNLLFQMSPIDGKRDIFC